MKSLNNYWKNTVLQLIVFQKKQALPRQRSQVGNKENSESIKITPKDERDIAKDLENIMAKLTSGEAGPASYNGEELDPEAAELFRDELEIALKRLKIINKEKYTPKKYKK